MNDPWRWGEAHHAYYGIILAVFGVLLDGWLGMTLAAVGAVIFLDDLLQHLAGFSPSPLHQLYVRYVYERYAWVRRLNAWVDHLL